MDFPDIFKLPTLTELKTALLALCQSADPPLPVTQWVLGSPSERWSDIIPRLVESFLAIPTTQALRDFFLDLTTDPGDAGDISADQTPRPGLLSAFGASWYGVKRGGQTYEIGRASC